MKINDLAAQGLGYIKETVCLKLSVALLNVELMFFIFRVFFL